MNKNKIIELKNGNKIYKTKVEEIHILKNINLAFNKGDFISIQGKSGSGKTSLLNMYYFSDLFCNLHLNPTRSSRIDASKFLNQLNQ